MRQIVKSVKVREAGTNNEWQTLPMIPSSGSYEKKITSDEHGSIIERSLSLNVHRIPEIVMHNLEITVVDENDIFHTFGTAILPVRFEITQNPVIQLSINYKSVL